MYGPVYLLFRIKGSGVQSSVLDILGILDIFQRAVHEVLVPWPCLGNPELMTLNELLYLRVQGALLIFGIRPG